MHFAFIHNPKAGKQSAAQIDQLKDFRSPQFTSSWHAWDPIDALPEILKEVNSTADVIVSVGGDGTNRAIANWLITQPSPLPLAFLPTGSGNGLARHLGLVPPQAALNRLMQGSIKPIDTLKVNGHYALNATGIGLSGLVSGRFGSNQIRGLNGYLRQVVNLYRQFEPFSIASSDATFHYNGVLSMEIGNGCEWGNGFCFAPNAKLDDGEADLACIHKFPLLQLPRIIRKMKRHEEAFNNWQASRGTLLSNTPQPWHTDGEYHPPVKEWEFEIMPKSLSIFV